MLAPFVTLAFLAALWLVAVTLAEKLSQNGWKIAAAVRGRSPLATATELHAVAVRVSHRSRPLRVLRAQPRLRAAA